MYKINQKIHFIQHFRETISIIIINNYSSQWFSIKPISFYSLQTAHSKNPCPTHIWKLSCSVWYLTFSFEENERLRFTDQRIVWFASLSKDEHLQSKVGRCPREDDEFVENVSKHAASEHYKQFDIDDKKFCVFWAVLRRVISKKPSH